MSFFVLPFLPLTLSLPIALSVFQEAFSLPHFVIALTTIVACTKKQERENREAFNL